MTLDYNVRLSELAHKKIMYWVNKSNKEVSGFGIIEYDKEKKTFYVTDSFLIEQTVGLAHTDIDERGLAKLMYETAKLNGELLFWWHSHVKMSCFWSGTDLDTIKNLGKNGWIVASVFNQNDEIRSACAYLANSSLNDNKPELVLYDDIQTFIEQPELSDEFKEYLDKEFATKVKEPVYSTTYYNGQTYSNFEDFMSRHNKSDNAIESAVVKQIANQTDSELDSDLLNESIAFGLRGYGAAFEARALGLKYDQYISILKLNNFNQLANLEDRLIVLESDGTIDNMLKKQSDKYENKEKRNKNRKGEKNAKHQ